MLEQVLEEKIVKQFKEFALPEDPFRI